MKPRDAGNIYSGDKQLAVLTNPTSIARWKGTLVRDYPVVIDSVRYRDAEQAYQQLAAECKHDTARCYAICQRVIEHKLQQYPQIVQLIDVSGGVEWLKRCSHWIGERRIVNRWTGDGLQSGYIRCLVAAYERVKTPKFVECTAFYRVVAPHFVAGIEFRGAAVSAVAPILSWVKRNGMSIQQFDSYCQRNGWHREEI
jgi:hypothetical protein